jgi:hypothetical protein
LRQSASSTPKKAAEPPSPISSTVTKQASEEWPSDDLGTAIPDDLRSAFESRPQFDECLILLKTLKGKVNPIMGDADKIRPVAGGEKLASERQTLINHLDGARSLIKNSRPYGICPYCKGTLKYTGAKCPCKTGWVDRHTYEAAPREMQVKRK